jgi:hypothetical protein
MTKERWNSVWYQLDEITRIKPKSVLEIGPGAGYLKSILSGEGIDVQTADIAADLEPDHLVDIQSLPFSNKSFDIVCAFQVLEHMPLVEALRGLSHMARVARRAVLISLPDSRQVWRYQFQIPKLGELRYLINRPFVKNKEHVFDGEHYWEINKPGYELDSLCAKFSTIESLRLIKTYRPYENPTHRFFTFERVC